uniref:Signal transducer n=1 Tax=Solanum tuberosum TaxID=4113 RepID=M1BLJ8_SOLTU
MKFMKLGSRPDTFITTEAVRSVNSEVVSDLIVQVKGSRYLLHKFPLLSKCSRLQRLCSESPETSQHQIVQLPDFPGGIEAFELCAKFCYGITITLSAYNIVAARCAAEYLQMTEDVEKGNLIYKLEVFFNSCILSGWKDSIVTLQSTKSYPLWSEDLVITSRCIEAIASKVLAHPSKVNLSRTYSRRGPRDDISCIESDSRRHNKDSSKIWWAEDLAELSIDLYWRSMIAIKSGGKVPAPVIGDALRIYASRWLPNISKYANLEKQIVHDQSESDSIGKHRLLLESIISLLPAEKGAVSCSFLLKLLKATNILKGSCSSKMELARRVGLQLEDASVNDLLIPCVSHTCDTIYDVDIVITILQQFMLQGHPGLNKNERKRLCRILDCKKLSMDVCMHAAQNELLPLRVVVQVLFFEQARTAMSGGHVTELPSNIKALLANHDDTAKTSASFNKAKMTPVNDQWSNASGLKSPKSNISTLKMKLAEDDDLDEHNADEIGKSSRIKALCVLPNRPKKMFSKLWSNNRSSVASEKN